MITNKSVEIPETAKIQLGNTKGQIKLMEYPAEEYENLEDKESEVTPTKLKDFLNDIEEKT